MALDIIPGPAWQKEEKKILHHPSPTSPPMQLHSGCLASKLGWMKPSSAAVLMYRHTLVVKERPATMCKSLSITMMCKSVFQYRVDGHTYKGRSLRQLHLGSPSQPFQPRAGRVRGGTFVGQRADISSHVYIYIACWVYLAFWVGALWPPCDL